MLAFALLIGYVETIKGPCVLVHSWYWWSLGIKIPPLKVVFNSCNFFYQFLKKSSISVSSDSSHL